MNTYIPKPESSIRIRHDYRVTRAKWAFLLHGVRLYHRQCPDCGAKWSPVLSGASVTRIGPEIFTCKCGTGWPTGYVEWAHLKRAERIRYFISEAEIGVAIISVFVPALFAYFLADSRWRGILTAVVWGAIVGVTFIAVLWIIKGCIVLRSLSRYGRVAQPSD